MDLREPSQGASTGLMFSLAQACWSIADTEAGGMRADKVDRGCWGLQTRLPP